MSKPHMPSPQKPTDLPNARPPTPGNLVSRSPRAPGANPVPEEDEHLELPHERDQRSKMTGGETRKVIQQASKDLEEGQVDTDMRNTPGLDAEQRGRKVPGPNGPPTPTNHASGPSDVPITKESQASGPPARPSRKRV